MNLHNFSLKKVENSPARAQNQFSTFNDPTMPCFYKRLFYVLRLLVWPLGIFLLVLSMEWREISLPITISRGHNKNNDLTIIKNIPLLPVFPVQASLSKKIPP